MTERARAKKNNQTPIRMRPPGTSANTAILRVAWSCQVVLAEEEMERAVRVTVGVTAKHSPPASIVPFRGSYASVHSEKPESLCVCVRDRPLSRQLRRRLRLQRECRRRLLHTFAQQCVLLSECAVAKRGLWRCQ